MTDIFSVWTEEAHAEPLYSPERDCTKGRPLPRSCSAVSRHKSGWQAYTTEADVKQTDTSQTLDIYIYFFFYARMQVLVPRWDKRLMSMADMWKSGVISEQTAIISLYSINWLVFVTETECVYCAVRTESLNILQLNLSV
jgi:hypothetical protein